MTIRKQMIVWIAVPTLIIYVVIIGLTMRSMYGQSTESVQRDMTVLAASYAARFDGLLLQAATIADTTARFLETSGPLSDEQLYAQLQRNVAQNALVYGACLAFEPGMLKPGDELFGPYVCREGPGFRRVNINRSVYDWYGDVRFTWFSEPKRLGRGVWSKPYFDEGAGNILMSTWSAPFRWKDKFAGVATVDVDLPRLKQTVAEDLKLDLDFVILTSSGEFVYDRDTSRIMSKNIFDVAKELKCPELASLAQTMLRGTPGNASIEGWDTPQQQLVFYAPIGSAGWIFACRFPENLILQEVRTRAIWNAVALGATLLLTIGCILMVSRMITSPIESLRSKVAEVGQGNLEVRIPLSGRSQEIRQLTVSFNRMTSDLRLHIDRLASEQAARQRIERDLDIAREIQRSLLPVTEPNLPGYEIAGWSRSADKTGGDYYDWQTLPDGRTLISLADVSGHGVGPALVTAVCRAYVRAGFATGSGFTDLVNHLNQLLIADLAAERFVTFAGALLDAGKQHIEVISAGHGPTIHFVCRERRLVEYHATDVPLGVMPQTIYAPAFEIELQPGDFLLFTTDGLFEWQRADGTLFGLDRLREAIVQLSDAPIHELIPRLYETVKSFADGTPQQDDVTAVVLRKKPN